VHPESRFVTLESANVLPAHTPPHAEVAYPIACPAT
jgi:hypothetical protein